MVTPDKPSWFDSDKHEVDPQTGVIKKKGWKVLSHTPANPLSSQMQEIGFTEVAKWLANAEGISVAQARARFEEAEANAKAEAKKKGEEGG